MEVERDFSVNYSTNIEHKSLYGWCLRQTQEDGTQMGPDLIPWGWSLNFEAAEVFHNISYSRDGFKLDDSGEDKIEDATSVDTREILEAKLLLVNRLSLPPRYYVFGYRDAVKMISLTVTRVNADTSCTAFGFAKYQSEIDFHKELIPHHLGFDLLLSEDKFDKILQLMRLDTFDSLSFRVGGVDGFYSDWSPGITTDNIYILPRSCLANLNLEEHADRLLTIGNVRNFQISATRKIIVDHKKEDDDL